MSDSRTKFDERYGYTGFDIFPMKNIDMTPLKAQIKKILIELMLHCKDPKLLKQAENLLKRLKN